MRITKTRTFKAVVILLIATGNVLFYTWGYPDSGAKAAWEVGWAFWAMWQGIFLYAIGGYLYFLIKNV
jgi:hypothetical protein